MNFTPKFNPPCQFHHKASQTWRIRFRFGVLRGIRRRLIPIPSDLDCNSEMQSLHRSKTMRGAINRRSNVHPRNGLRRKILLGRFEDQKMLVSGSCTSVGKKKKLEELGYSAYVFDANDPRDEVLEAILCREGLLESALKGGRLRWLAYLSSTSVYGDSGENPHSKHASSPGSYPAKPESEAARARLAAEEQWLCFGQNLGIAAHVFRLGGIYGPGRSAVDTILKQGPMSKGQKARSSKTYISRVHATYICQALNASISNPSAGKIYNIVDDDPAPREEVFEFARKLVEEKLSGHGKQDVYAEGAESSISEKPQPPKAEKRVSNAHLKEELGVHLLHPTYRSGLGGIVEEMVPLS
ncbi:hypothetical protein OROHE_005403 [Orobanche hederae]